MGLKLRNLSSTAVLLLVGVLTLNLAIGRVAGEILAEGCLNNADLFVLFSERLTFRDALTFCVDQGLTLARISNDAENDFVQDLLVGLNQDTWIGVANFGRRGNGLTDRFSFADNSQEGLDFFLERGRNPWRPGDPSQLSEPCVE